jgi:hypothetical protein
MARRALLSRRSLLAVLLFSAGCARDARVETQEIEPRGKLISMAAIAAPVLRSESLEARVEVLGLVLGTLESSVCTARGATTIATHLATIPLVTALHRSGGEARTVFDASLAPRLSEYHIQDGDLLRNYRVQYRPGAFEYAYDNGGPAHNQGRDNVPEGAAAQDLHSAMLLLRSWRPRLGQLGYFYVVIGRRLWRVDVEFAGPEMLTAQGRPQLAQRIDGVSVRLWQSEESKPRRFSLWLSEDPDRIPLRLVADSGFGEVKLELTARSQGDGGCSEEGPSARR